MKTQWKNQKKREAILPPPVPSPYSDHQNCRHTVSSVPILLFLRQIQPFSRSFLKSKTLIIERRWNIERMRLWHGERNRERGRTINTRAIQTRPKPDNPAKPPDDNSIPARTEGPVGRRRVSVLKNRHQRVEWRVRISKTRATRTDRSYKKIRPNPAKTSQIWRDLDQI